MMQDPLEPDQRWFETPIYGDLPNIGEKVFIFESGVRIGLGTVLGQNDDVMLVEIEFTQQPKLNELYYGLPRDWAGHLDGQ